MKSSSFFAENPKGRWERLGAIIIMLCMYSRFTMPFITPITELLNIPTVW